MSTTLVVLILTLVAALVLLTAVFMVGVRIGGRFWQSELQRTRFEAARAHRRLHDLTREAFVTMAEHAERQIGDR